MQIQEYGTRISTNFKRDKIVQFNVPCIIQTL